MLLPHYSLGLDIVVAYAKALNSSTLTSSLLWVVRAAMHTLLAHLFHSYAPVRQAKAERPARKKDGEYSTGEALPYCAHTWREPSAPHSGVSTLALHAGEHRPAARFWNREGTRRKGSGF